MATDKLKIMLSFLREVNEGNTPKEQDYDLDKDAYWNIIEACQNSGYISGATVSKGGQGNRARILFIENVQLTTKGMEYLKENSTIMKTYRGLKEIKDWVPFL